MDSIIALTASRAQWLQSVKLIDALVPDRQKTLQDALRKLDESPAMNSPMAASALPIATAMASA